MFLQIPIWFALFQALRVEFCMRLRAEQAFEGVDQLAAQISHDVGRVRRYAEQVRPLIGEKL